MLHQVRHHVGNFLPALRYPNYRLYFIGQGISLVGTWMQQIAEQWLIYPTLTNNKSLLGIVSAINLLPVTFIVLFAGVWADRVDRRKAQIVLQCLFSLIAFTMSYLIFSGRIQVWHVIVAALASGLVFAFDMPTRQALMVNLVDRQYFASALSLNGAIFNAARVVGPAVAGALIAVAGIAPAYFFNGVSFLAVIVSVYLMKLPEHPKEAQYPPFRRQLVEGFDFVRRTPLVSISLILVATLTIATWPVSTLMAVFAHDIFQRGEIGFGILTSAFGLGAMVGAFGFHALYHAVRLKDRLILATITTIAATTSIFALWHVFPIALVMLFLSGWSIATTIGTLNTVVQEVVPDNLRGRILSYYSFFLVGGMPLGALVASIGVGLVGAPNTIFFCAIAFFVISMSVIFATKEQFLSQLVGMT
ncbi:MFS transporter [Candidatus Gottesmanbacteria bacterium]|nr:MFS transporter [Candidatus Gottesmanbacteria bacterium]